MSTPVTNNDLPSVTFFADSSSRDSDYMVAGGFVMPGSKVNEIDERISELRHQAGIQSEFHWSKYRGGYRQDAYKRLVDFGFELTRRKQAAFHVIITKFVGYNHKQNPGENRDTSINRMYYQLALHRLARFYGKKHAIHLRLDHGNDCRDITQMRDQLCAHAFGKYETRPNCVRTIEPMDSLNSGLIQLADVMVGAIAAHRNNRQLSQPKADLAKYVLKKSGRQDWSVNTPMRARFLTIWNFRGKLKGGPPQS